MPDQHYVNCLGVFQHAGEHFVLSELVEDGDLSTTSQKSTYEYQSKSTVEKAASPTKGIETGALQEEMRKSSIEDEDQADFDMSSIATTSENGNTPRELYYGTRKHSSKIRPSKNVYDYIKRMNLGNLSGLPKIP